MYRFIKRFFDISFSTICMIPFIFILVIVTILIKYDDRGPVFYKGARIGKNGKKFYMIKFRSMKVDAPDIRGQDGCSYNSSTDARLTNIGKYLRETSIDEIPQILNILLGDMSLIGPRASLWGTIDGFEKEELQKLMVRPGITGFTQAYYRNGLSLREKRKKDVWYVNNASFLLDLKILFRTTKTVLKKENLYTFSK